MSQVLETFLSRNEAYTQHHKPLPPLPSLNTIVVSCIDARIDPAHILGIAPGEALVIRTAGGRVTEAVEQEVGMIIAMVAKLTGRAPQPKIVLIHHTDCGMEKFKNAELVTHVSHACGVSQDYLEQIAIGDHSASLKNDLEKLKNSSYLPNGLEISGLIYNQSTGRASVDFANVIS